MEIFVILFFFDSKINFKTIVMLFDTLLHPAYKRFSYKKVWLEKSLNTFVL